MKPRPGDIINVRPTYAYVTMFRSRELGNYESVGIVNDRYVSMIIAVIDDKYDQYHQQWVLILNDEKIGWVMGHHFQTINE